MAKTAARALLLCCLMSIVAFAQAAANPDLSGTWIFNPSKSHLPEGADLSAETLVIAASRSKVVMRFTSNGKESKPVTYVPDGKEHSIAQFQGGEDVTIASWKKSVLLVETIGRVKAAALGGDELESFHYKDRWTLSADGQALTQESKSEGAVSIVVYDKQ
jgi:hypothetical protein